MRRKRRRESDLFITFIGERQWSRNASAFMHAKNKQARAQHLAATVRLLPLSLWDDQRLLVHRARQQLQIIQAASGTSRCRRPPTGRP